MTESKNSPKGAKGLILLPYFSGERTPIHNSQAKGVFFGLNLTHHRGDLFRALIEGIAYGTRHVTDTFRDLGQTPSKVFAVGGGTKNMLWLQATSDITGVNQYVRNKTIGASYGDAFLAALSINAVERSDIEKWNPIKRTVKHKAHPNYESNYKIFRQLYESTKDLMREI